MPKANSTLFLERALLLAQKAESIGEVPVGALVVFEGKIVGRGFNRRESRQDPCGHAEVKALQAASKKLNSWRLKSCTLFVTLEPCPMCLAACQQARVERVVYGAKDPKGGALSLGYRLNSDLRLNHRFEVEYLPFEPASMILREFFKKRRKSRHT